MRFSSFHDESLGSQQTPKRNEEVLSMQEKGRLKKAWTKEERKESKIPQIITKEQETINPDIVRKFKSNLGLNGQ